MRLVWLAKRHHSLTPCFPVLFGSKGVKEHFRVLLGFALLALCLNRWIMFDEADWHLFFKPFREELADDCWHQQFRGIGDRLSWVVGSFTGNHYRRDARRDMDILARP